MPLSNDLISQFVKATNDTKKEKTEKTVYETARTSMEDLANRGFYRKLQIGKKFVYTPIPLKEIND